MRMTTRGKAQHAKVDSSPDQASDVEGATERPSRRSFVFFGALAAATLIPKASRAQASSRKRRIIEQEPADISTGIVPNESVAAFAEWDSPVSRLVRRATLGITAAEVTHANALGWQGYLNYQLN
ncbi:MAG TPA: hypothetical protein VF132_05175 [Rudaea sp.]